MKIRINSILLTISFILLISCKQRALQQEEITAQELSKWKTLDKGKSTVKNDELIIEETKGSNGYFLISPKTYKGDFIINYKVKAMSESSVLITLFSASQKNDTDELILPENDASPEEFWQWRSNMKHYNLTFNNKSHGYKPFFFKNMSPHSRGFYQTLPDNITEVGKWYDVEIGKKGTHLWFKLNNNIVFNVEDCNPLNDGHLIFRISGTTGDKTILAKAAIKNIVISYQ
ncbi:family 16 glycoside hydrolase [Aquimarina sp. MMG016]|uniref:family 16 glycoside hydrolase n=1 Tax=Aquimarina sp. MMG016 TaxID=2822690 RepID=UPI001B3A7B19|nr:family 16 glycoside hydrolase [Aquimarina sp. MMG016]MBQ4821167.1 DUF1080 domain-containing protein [Aquimarina sp. MMG016]